MTTKRTFLPLQTLAMCLLLPTACAFSDKELGSLEQDSDQGGNFISTSDGGDGSDGASASETSGSTGLPLGCGGDRIPSCLEDEDHDNVPLACDNAPDYFNPSQSDMDGDSLADPADRCQTVAGTPEQPDNDSDGIGNACDACPFTPGYYDDLSEPGALPDALRVRPLASAADFDQDGIGDACDNCVALANCGGFSVEEPWGPGVTIDRSDTESCQRDEDRDGVGDECAGMIVREGAAGPVGSGSDDDFDQDGLSNGVDRCPRLPSLLTCTSDEACGPGGSCVLQGESGTCNHADHDGDGVGDACDSCATSPNPEQLTGAGQVADDPDGDTVGNACELSLDCSTRVDPPPSDFYSLAVEGHCCIALLTEAEDGGLVIARSGQPLQSPDGVPIRLECDAESAQAGLCVALPPAVAATPGVLLPPAGCSEVLGNIDPTTVAPVDVADVDNLEALWAYRCTLPQLDQDFDGIGDECDLCPFVFDPTNEPYVDAQGKLWPLDGRYCNGEYSPEAICGE
ncbi:MAG: thrombospondin type 3 repeat-containing protein [Nannocystaceae bacterium]|nr:thrombospondin type 3 repeat-containing protein [Nannocystaceae bacterium]